MIPDCHGAKSGKKATTTAATETNSTEPTDAPEPTDGVTFPVPDPDIGVETPPGSTLTCDTPLN